MKFLKRSIAVLLSILLIGIFLFNIRLYYTPAYTSYGSKQVNQDLVQHLAHLKEELHSGAATDMQDIYPEGYVFLNALYGLSWIDIAEALDQESELSKEAYEEIDWVLSELKSSFKYEDIEK